MSNVRARRVECAIGRATHGLAAVVLALVGGGLLVSACTSPRDVLGPTDSPCYRAIAVARLAVHERGDFTGVRYVPGAALTGILGPSVTNPAQRLGYGPRTGLCLVAYRGSFDEKNVEHGLQEGPHPDRLAVVVVRELDERVVATLVVQQAPLPLTKVFPILR